MYHCHLTYYTAEVRLEASTRARGEDLERTTLAESPYRCSQTRASARHHAAGRLSRNRKYRTITWAFRGVRTGFAFVESHRERGNLAHGLLHIGVEHQEWSATLDRSRGCDLHLFELINQTKMFK